jgi:hypothetical protein
LFAEGSGLLGVSSAGSHLWPASFWDQLEFPGSFARVKRLFGHAEAYPPKGRRSWATLRIP